MLSPQMWMRGSHLLWLGSLLGVPGWRQAKETARPQTASISFRVSPLSSHGEVTSRNELDPRALPLACSRPRAKGSSELGRG